MRVRDLCSGRVVTVLRRSSLREAAHVMWDHGVDALLVIEGGQLQGIVTEGDLMRCIASEGEPDLATVGSCMTRDPSVVPPELEDRDAAERMLTLGIRHLPVVDNGTVLGVLSVTDLLRVDVGAALGAAGGGS